jgi:hypothetical protein
MPRDIPKSKPNAFVQALRNSRDKAAPREGDGHQDVLEHLGAAVMLRWAHLPRDVQRDLFNAAVDLNEPDADSVRQHIAVFLHQHKDDAHIVDGGGES